MNAYLRALQTDPRFVACMAAILPLILDDVPEPTYATFRDAGGALILSLTFADGVALMFVRRVPQRTLVTQFFKRWWLSILVALLCKYFVQSVLYVSNAGPIDLAIFLGSHWLIAAFASSDYRWRAIFRRIATGSGVVVLSFCLMMALTVLLKALMNRHANWFGERFTADFFPFALMRMLMPYTFWTVVLSPIRHESRSWRRELPTTISTMLPPAG